MRRMLGERLALGAASDPPVVVEIRRAVLLRAIPWPLREIVGTTGQMRNANPRIAGLDLGRIGASVGRIVRPCVAHIGSSHRSRSRRALPHTHAAVFSASPSSFSQRLETEYPVSRPRFR